MQKNKNLWIALIVVAIIAIIGWFTPSIQQVMPSFAGTTNYDALQVSKLTVGTSGTGFGAIISGTCTLRSDFSIAATSTAMVDCVSSSFQSGDVVIINGFATSSTAISRQYLIQSTGVASTTNGFAPVRVTNLTGAAAIPSAINGFGSSTPFIIYRPLSTTPGL